MYTPLENEKNRKFSACTIVSLTIRAASATVVHTVEQPEIEYKILVILRTYRKNENKAHNYI